MKNKFLLPLLAALSACSTTSPREKSAPDRIIEATLAGNDSYKKLEALCDGVGNRLSGSESLNKAVEWAVKTLQEDGQENVHTEKVMVPRWVRGRESLTLIEPRRAPIAMLGLGGSIATPPQGITAEVVVVKDEKELDELGDRGQGKIILFNNPMPAYDPARGAGYGETVRFRVNGARLASEKGAVACLVRSVTAMSLRSPHTGGMNYGNATRKIPAAAISTEDAGTLARLTARGIRVVVELKMEAKTEDPVPSGNVIAELRGSTNPDEVVVISGHLDSWDVGQGAHDDGAGVVTAMEALHVIRRLGLRPRRTIRVVLWVNEENGLAGARQYAADHAADLPRHVAAIEADSGGFRPTGFSVEHRDKAVQSRAAEELQKFLRGVKGLGELKAKGGGSGADVGQMGPGGVLLMGLEVDESKYFDYHHTHADTLDKVNPDELTRCVASMAVVAFMLADHPRRLGSATK